MNKPTIFFSHSSLDKRQLGRLKEVFCAKTGGAIDVFLSSDGQSIPLGTNWVYRVQEGLESAALMLVFITPNSVGSSWIYFEAGFSYAKQIRVIPIGFLGFDLLRVGHPLSLLQGFNITSGDTLNNLIALANDQFKHTHPLAFLPSDYDNIVGAGAARVTGPFREILQHIEDIRVEFNMRDSGLKAELGRLIGDISVLLRNASIEHQTGESFIRMRGLMIYVEQGVLPAPLKMIADATAIHVTLPTLVKIITSIRNDGVRGASFYFTLVSGLEVAEKDFKITARLYDSEIRLPPDGGLLFRNFSFTTGHYHSFTGRTVERSNAYVGITPIGEEFNTEDAASLLKLLLRNNIIYEPRSEFPSID
jgi:hypothetical protein